MASRGRGVACIAAIAAACLLAAAGCSRDRGDRQTGAGVPNGATNPFAGLRRVSEPNPCRSEPGVNRTEITVGVISVESPPAAASSFAPAENGIEARIEKANREHELGTRTIRLIARDDHDDPTRNREVARELVEAEHVFGIIEVSDRSGASAPYLDDKDVPVTGWHVGVAAWGRYPNMFTFRQPPSADPDHSYTTRDAQLLKTLGATKVALIGGATSSSAGFIDRVDKSIRAVGGLEIVDKDTSVPAGKVDFATEAARIKDRGADALLTGLDLAQNAALGAALTTAGLHLKAMVFPAGYDPRVLDLPAMEGAVFGLEFKPLEAATPAAVEFDAWLPKGQERGQMSYTGWLSAETFIQGIKDAGAGCPTRKAFINNLRMERAYTANGAFDPVDLEAGFGLELACLYYVKVVSKRFVTEFDGNPFCGKSITFR